LAHEKIISYDLFLTHAWRFHDDWNRFAELLDRVPGLVWRNFSLPWHDPAMNPNTEVGGKFIRDSLERQIIPVHSVILLAGVHAINSARAWLDMEIEMARNYNKPIVGVPAVGMDAVPGPIQDLCDATCPWNGEQLIATVDELLALPKFNVRTGDL
jgi:hypothetical protein